MGRRPRNIFVVAGIGIALTVVGAVLGLAVWALLGRGHPSRITVTASGRAVRLSAGLTIGQAASTLQLQPRSGDVLDVQGQLLRSGVVPGALLLNGRTVAPETKLHDGDRITMLNGHDRTEPLRRETVGAPNGIPGEPQFTLSRRPGSLLIVRGALSKKVVSVRFRPIGGKVTIKREVALTFDDGPSPLYTPRVLRILRRLRVPATFFVVGYLAEEYPSLVQRELKAGMTVGNHSYNHPEVPPFDELPRQLMDDEIVLGGRGLRRLGVRPDLFRPPGGSFSPPVVRAAEARGQRVVLWSVDPGDWQHGVQPGQIARRVLRAVRPGSIVILHDGGGDRSATVAALPAIVRGIRQRGLRLVALGPP